LNSRRSTIAWIASIALLAIFSGLSWLNLELSPEAGAQKFEISGFQVFPIISALLLLQVAALLASLLTPKMVSRVISGMLSPIMLAHGLFVFLGLQSSLQSAIEAQITEITGVAGFASQAEFVAFAGDTYLWVGYLLAISLNLAILLTKSLSKVAHSEARPAKEALVDEQDLWETQK
jgi:hypothetical protein